MKKLYAILVALLYITAAQAQRTDSIDFARVSKSPVLEARFKDKLVELAATNPTQDGLDAKQKINGYEISNAKAAWLNHFVVSGNLNEYSIKNNSQYNYYPRYNFGLILPLGDFVTIPNNVKIARINNKVIEAQKGEAARFSKSTVLKLYENYKANSQLLELETPLLEDTYNTYQQVEKKFARGETQIEDLNAIYRNYNTEQVRNIQLRRDLQQFKIDIETMIGVTFEEALQMVKQ